MTFSFTINKMWSGQYWRPTLLYLRGAAEYKNPTLNTTNIYINEDKVNMFSNQERDQMFRITRCTHLNQMTAGFQEEAVFALA